MKKIELFGAYRLLNGEHFEFHWEVTNAVGEKAAARAEIALFRTLYSNDFEREDVVYKRQLESG
ncbi:hypothetical protein Barb6XT_01746 [Bacteroidales bacterium Barb6XT]|nr:hypothetical protein Barb6XT_01746 [Bacteroidales bacterium Barb6XT]